MEKIRINNDVEFYYNVYRNGVPESFIGASEISVKLVNEAYTEEIPITYSIAGNVLKCNALAENLTKCGVCRMFLSYTKSDKFTTDAVPFQLVGLREDTTVEVGEPIIVSGDIGVNKDGASAYEVWESYPGNEGKTIEQYFEWLHENPTKIDLDGLNSNIDKLHFNTDTLVQLANIGDVRYSQESRTLEVKVSDTVSIQLGQEMQTRVKNDEAVQINNGQMVYINSAVGANPLAKIASTSNADVAQKTFGMATENIPANGFGAITTEGLVRDINTSAFPEGSMLWLGTNGSVTNIEPVAPAPKISVGMVLRSNANSGVVYVKIRAIARNQKLSDVYAPTLTGGDVLRWNSTTLRFETFNITSALNNKVDTSRTITAGNGLTGGGSLTEDITINIGNTDDSIVVGEDGIKVDTQDTLTSDSASKPLSAKQGKALQDNKAEKTRNIVAGAGLTGGGDLSADRTINIANADDSLVVAADSVKVNTNNTLTSTSTTQPLSANQGKVLNEKVAQVETDLNTIHKNGIVESFRYDYVNKAYEKFNDLNNLSLRHITTDSNELFTLKTNTASYGHILQSVNYVSGNKYIIYVELNVKNIYYDKNIDMRIISQGSGIIEPMKLGLNNLIYRFTSSITEMKDTYVQFPLSGGLPVTSGVLLADFNLNKLIVILDEGQTDEELLLYNELSYKSAYNSLKSVYAQKANTAEGLEEIKSNTINAVPINSNYNFNGSLSGWSRNNTIYSICTFDENNIMTWEGQYTGAAYPDIRRTITLTSGKYYAVVKAKVLSIDSSDARFVLASSPTTFYSTYKFNFVGEEILIFSEFNVTESKTPLVFLQIAGGTGLIQGQKIASVELYSFAVIESPSELSKSDILSVLNDGYISFSKKSLYTKNIYPSLIGKKWNAIGDSITAQATYINPVIDYFKFVSCKNISAGGKSISGAASVPNPRMWEDAIINQIEADAWLITIMGGTNDWASNALIGTNEDTDGLTFKGAVKLIIQKISTLYPQSRLVFCGCPYGELYDKPSSAGWPNAYTNLLGLTTRDYAKAVKEVCEIYGIPFVDIISNSGWNTYNIRTYVKDDGGLLHPLPDGGERIASVIRGVVSSIIPKTVDNY